MSKNTLLISVQTVKDKSPVHKNMDDSLIFPEIKVAQDQNIVNAIGQCLMDRLQEGIENNDLTADENTLIDDYIADALVQFTLAGLPLTSMYQFFTKGVLSRTAENAQLPTLNDMIELSQRYQNRAQWYRERLINYLKDNREVFPLYDDCGGGCGNDIKPEDSGYSVCMWLGDD